MLDPTVAPFFSAFFYDGPGGVIPEATEALYAKGDYLYIYISIYLYIYIYLYSNG